jgi:serine/threonine protein kinase
VGIGGRLCRRNQSAGPVEACRAMHESAEPTTETLQARTDFDAGHRIDRYELRELIGRGGMGSVYRAIDTKLGRTVALKTVAARRTGARLTDRVRQRFLREAMALSKVEHRNVVQVMDFGFADDGTPFLVMEHLRGRDLGTLLAESDAPPTIACIVDIMLGVCAALRACHRVGIVHRDLKPGNIFLADTDTGTEVKVLDFGVSKAPSSDDLTREGQIVGTPQYLAPEQVDGKVGPASDQYALGVLIYACLTLRLPYEDHQSFGLLRAIETGKFESPRMFRPDLPEALERIVLRAMHVSPGERFESVYALGQQLWELASPRGQDEWRNYYFPPLSGHRPPARDSEVSKTQILQRPPTADPTTIGGALLYLSTKLARSRSPDPEVTPADEAERAPSVDTDIGRRRGRLHLPALAVALAIVVVGVCVARGRARHRHPSPSQLAANLAGPARPSVPQPPGRRAEAARPPVPGPPVGRPESLELPVVIPTRAAKTTPVAQTIAAEPEISPSPSTSPLASKKNHLSVRRHAPSAPALPNIDHNGIGIPTD